MDAINTLRAILAAGAALAAVVAAISGRWLTVLILGIGLVAHAMLWVRQYRDAHAAHAAAPLDPAG